MKLFRNLGLFALLISIAGLQSCTFQELTFDEIQEIGFSEENNTELLILTALITNPNNKEVELINADFKLFVGDIELGDAELTEPVIVQGGGQFPVQSRWVLSHEKSSEEILTSVGLKMLFGDAILIIKGNAQGKYGILKKDFPIQHEEKITLDELSKMFN